MPNLRFDKLFSPEEVNALIPRLEDLVRRIQIEAANLRQGIAGLALEDPALEAMDLAEVLERHPRLRVFAARMADAASELESMGCLLKDIDQGLVDFPFEVGEDEIAFLCWQYGEPQVVAWHALDRGFAGRRPLPGARRPYLN